MAVAAKVEFLGANRDGEPRRFAVASGTAIAKGTLLALSGARLAAAHASTGQNLAGVAAAAKSATDYADTISAITQAIMTFTASGAITAGAPVRSSNVANSVEVATNADIGAIVLGNAVSDATGNLVEVRINL